MRAFYAAIEGNTRKSGAGMRLESTLGVYLERIDWLHSRIAANADVSVLFDQAL